MEESRLKKSGRNIFYAIIQNFLTIFLSFLSRVIFIRVLDISYLGVNGLFSNILNILSLTDMGMTTAMMYSLYKPIAENDTEKIKSLIGFFKRVYLIIATAVFIVGMSLIPFLQYIVNLPSEMENIYYYYIVLLLNVVISYLFIYRTTLLNADQKNYVLNKYIISFKIVTFLAQTIVLFIFKNYMFYIVVALILNFCSNLVQNNVTLKHYPYLKEKESLLEKQDRRGILKDVKALFLYRISGVVQSNTDNILVSIYVGTIYVGYYSNYILFINAIIIFLGLIFNNVKATIGNILNSKVCSKKEKNNLFWRMELANYCLISFISISFICLVQDTVSLLFGKDYILNIGIVIIVTLNFYTSNIRQNIWVFRETTGLFHETRYITLITAILNLILSVILGKIGGLFGIVAATVMARMCYAWWKEPQILFAKVLGGNSRKYLLTYIKRLLLLMVSATITYSCCGLIKYEVLLVNIMLKMMISLIIPNVINFIVYKNTDEFQYFYNRLVQPFYKRIVKG